MPALKGNKYAIGNNGGRPPIYNNPKQLAKKVDEYFIYIKGEYRLEKKGRRVNKVCDREEEPATITGLTLYLGFSSRKSLEDYEGMEEFSTIIKRARARVEYEYEKSLHKQSPAGAIFALKNMGWQDRIINENKHQFDTEAVIQIGSKTISKE